MTAADLWASLAADGVVDGAMPEPGPAGSPWFVRLMLGIAGWIGALFLLAFVGSALTSVMERPAPAIIVGATCCAGALALFRRQDGNALTDQFALALSLAGQGLLIVGLGQAFGSENPVLYFAVAVVEVALALAPATFLHRLLTAGGTAGAAALAVDRLSLHGLDVPLLCAALVPIWLNPARWAVRGRVWRPVGYGIVLALVLVEASRLLGGEHLYDRTETAGWMVRHGPLVGRALTGAVLVWAAAVTARRDGLLLAGRDFVLAVGAIVLAGLLGLAMPGLASALLLLMLGFAAGNRLLMALGIIALLGSTAHFYYNLDTTLLAKSGLLAVTGLCLVGASLLLRRGPRSEEVRHA